MSDPIFIAYIALGLCFASYCIVLVQAFKESALWGALCFFIPASAWVFIIVFWNRRVIVRTALALVLAGMGLLMAINLSLSEEGASSNIQQLRPMASNKEALETFSIPNASDAVPMLFSLGLNFSQPPRFAYPK